MKKIVLLLLAVTLLFTSCSYGGSRVRRDFFTSDDRGIANERFEQVIEAIQNQDSDALKSLFSENALNLAKDMDEAIYELFGYYQGELLSYNDWSALNVDYSKERDGSRRKRLYSTYDVETSQGSYRFAMEFIPEDTADTGNVGIRSLYVIKLEDDTDPSIAYRGDGKYTPGININKKNVI